MATGVQREEVWAAADALLSLGQRPTIEKVRQHIGRGSPNTVSPMLDQWFATLGARLGLAGVSPISANSAIEHNFPGPLQHAMQELWKAALRIADDHLQAKAEALEAREEALLERKRLLEDEKDVLSRTLPALHEQIAHLREQLERASAEVVQLTADKTRVETEARGLRVKLHEHEKALVAQTAQAESRLAEERDRHGMERRRLSLEVDQARQQFKEADLRAESAERTLSQARQEFIAERATLNAELTRALSTEKEVRARLADTKFELEGSRQRVAELQAALAEATTAPVTRGRIRPLRPKRGATGRG